MHFPIWMMPTPTRTVNAVGRLLEIEALKDEELKAITETICQYLGMGQGSHISFEVTTIPKNNQVPTVIMAKGLGWNPNNGGLHAVPPQNSTLRIITDWAIMFSIMRRRRRVPKSNYFPDGYIYGYDMGQAFRDGYLYYASNGQVPYLPVIPYLNKLKEGFEQRVFPKVLHTITAPKEQGGFGVQLPEVVDAR